MELQHRDLVEMLKANFLEGKNLSLSVNLKKKKMN